MFNQSNQPIFLQLADQIKEQILEGKIKADEKIPSVRELAATFEVNNNTAMHTVESLARQNIIYKSRGVGYYVTKEAKDLITSQKLTQFKQNFIPLLIKTMRHLGISNEELLTMLNHKED